MARVDRTKLPPGFTACVETFLNYRAIIIKRGQGDWIAKVQRRYWRGNRCGPYEDVLVSHGPGVTTRGEATAEVIEAMDEYLRQKRLIRDVEGLEHLEMKFIDLTDFGVLDDYEHRNA